MASDVAPWQSAAGLAEVYRTHASTVARWVARLGGPGVEVEDLTHEVFLVVERKLSGFRGEAELGTWLYRITRNVVANDRRKRRIRRFVGLERELVEPGPGPEHQLERRRRVLALYAALERLSGPDRELLVLCEIEGWPMERVAETLGITRNAAYVRLHRARSRFEKVFGEPTP